MPATEDHKTAVVVVVGHSGVLPGRGLLFTLRHDVLPVHTLDIHEAGCVDAGTEGTGLGLTEVGALTAEDEVFPGRNGLNHDSGVIPAGDTVIDIIVSPLARLKIELDHAAELRVAVPATVRVKLVIDDEDGVTTTADGIGLSSVHGLIMVPGLSLQIEAENVIEGLAFVVVTTVATIDEHLAVVERGAHVGTGKGCTDVRVIVGGTVNLTFNTLPDDVWVVGVRHLEDPAVIETDCGASVTTEDEDLVLRLGLGAEADSGVLSTRAR